MSGDDPCDNGDCRTCWPAEGEPPINPGQKLISTREQLNVSQTAPGWAGDVSAWPKSKWPKKDRWS